MSQQPTDAPAPTDVVGVLRIHLEEVIEALDLARTHFSALDLAEGLRNVKASRPSRATALMERTLDRVNSYLETGEE